MTEEFSPAQFFHDLEEYLTEEFHFGDTARAFLTEYVPLFAQHLLGGGENLPQEDIPLALHHAFLRYQELLEGKLGLFLERRDVSPRQFYTWCRGASESTEADGGHREFIQILCASETFELFFDLMSQTVHMQAATRSLQQESAQLETLETFGRDDGLAGGDGGGRKNDRK
jgi:hypothetical protein